MSDIQAQLHLLIEQVRALHDAEEVVGFGPFLYVYIARVSLKFLPISFLFDLFYALKFVIFRAPYSPLPSEILSLPFWLPDISSRWKRPFVLRWLVINIC